MNINIKLRKGIDSATEKLLIKHRDRILKKYPSLFGWLDVNPPKSIVLVSDEFDDASGCLFWHPKRGLKIAINTEYCLTLPDKGIWVADHELAHIGAICKYNDWTHRQRFKDICKFVRGKNCKACKYCR